MPTRIQRKRAKGWRLPPGTVYVGRPTVWGNPFQVGTPFLVDNAGVVAPCKPGEPHTHLVASVSQAAWLYSVWLPRQPLFARIGELRSKDLLCWCRPGEPCHADFLIERANR